ncbi:23S rRNA (pseudouridine(1915)-N(3))-methyltransferase RlmH [Methylonatrum kenyense]|uniref:23S rRNA (pseudouridine(1915)-N(3))-methyltransferase RlmH n=1 Tax=Methylonatrum kenyense TaxID=455253 RepID=UPI0020BFBE89|nr:23S rRNA (pseudouridine(1915)-N(3))-methyltransferase RlmH [Methylonatrum kenyense]MCK8516244.1 23S rRNA (pseudouridine(1915)-N(3))-methyltransferase RlmH [Methylonatrum kenyense]
MRLHLLAIGRKMPDWVAQGFRTYAERMPKEMPLLLRELSSGDRGKGANPARARDVEAERLLQALPQPGRVVCLDQRGRQQTTEALAERLSDWRQDGRDVAFIVGGPDGLARPCLDRADESWSLSRLTLPHMLVRVLLAEQLYRGSTILAGHPYHR